MTLRIFDHTGVFAENKDVAAQLRENVIVPTLEARKRVVLDFTQVDLATQSFIHALVSDALRRNGEPALERLVFKGCTRLVRGIVETVVQYSLEAIAEENEAS